MIVDLETPVAEGAVQQLTLPHSIGGRVCEVIHVALQLRISQISLFLFIKMLEVLLLSFFFWFFAIVHFLDCRHIRCRRRSNPLLYTGFDSSDLHCKGLR